LTRKASVSSYDWVHDLAVAVRRSLRESSRDKRVASLGDRSFGDGGGLQGAKTVFPTAIPLSSQRSLLSKDAPREEAMEASGVSGGACC